MIHLLVTLDFFNLNSMMTTLLFAIFLVAQLHISLVNGIEIDLAGSAASKLDLGPRSNETTEAGGWNLYCLNNQAPTCTKKPYYYTVSSILTRKMYPHGPFVALLDASIQANLNTGSVKAGTTPKALVKASSATTIAPAPGPAGAGPCSPQPPHSRSARLNVSLS